jgi:small conductance mechanosensitive channel
MEQITHYAVKLTDLAVSYLPTLALTVAILLAGFWLIRRINRMSRKLLERSKFEHDLVTFLSSLSDIGLKILLLLIAAGVAGIEMTSVVAVMAAAGFAVGLALQGSLANFAAGIIILVFRPYKVGDWIEFEDYFGKVESIQIFSTILETPGRKTLIVPNGQVIDGIVTNFSTKGIVRMELSVTMPYAESFPRVEGIIREVLAGIEMVKKEPEPEVGIEAYDSHSITVTVRPYVNPDDYWDVHFETYRLIKKAFYENNIKVAYSEGVEMGNIGE